MIVARAPYRISFFGGGTDYPEWFQNHGGAFLSLAIDHYCYIALRIKPPFQEKRYRVAWRITEDVNYVGDLPGGSGLGSSSAFTVALNHALHTTLGNKPNALELANQAYFIEREKLEETIGIQDQIATAFGGFNYVIIKRNGSYIIEKVLLTKKQIENFLNRIILVYTGISRLASSVSEKKVKEIVQKESVVKEMQEMVIEAKKLIQQDKIDEFGTLLDKNWQLKRSISNIISNNEIDNLYSLAISNGALGGKLLGAGAGGFLMFLCKEGEKEKLSKIFDTKMIVPFGLCNQGSQIVYNETKSYEVL